MFAIFSLYGDTFSPKMRVTKIGNHPLYGMTDPKGVPYKKYSAGHPRMNKDATVFATIEEAKAIAEQTEIYGTMRGRRYEIREVSVGIPFNL